MWLLTAKGLIDAAAVNYFNAVDQAKRYDAAYSAAIERAEQVLHQSGDSHAIEFVTEVKALFLPTFLLAGFAIENLLKGIIVKNEPHLIGDDKVGVPAIHRLVELAARAKVALNSDEVDLLARLTEVTEWSGRYPVALGAARFSAVGLDREAPFKSYENDYAVAISLVNRLSEALVGYDISPGIDAVWLDRKGPLG